jgi:capsular polysaccharide biosynthesis protein
MELLHYWHIVRKRLWLVICLVIAVLLSYWAFAPRHTPSFSAHMRFVVGVRPEPGTGDYYTYDRYYTWLTAEYLLDDLSEVVKSRVFAQDVAVRAGLDIPVGAIQGATSSGKLHRILTVQVGWHDRAELERIANAVVEILRSGSATYFAQLSTENALVSLIDPPQIGLVGPSLRQRLDLPLRLILALTAGVALTFLFDYLDRSVRNRDDLRELGIPILAEVPPHRPTAWRRLWPRRFNP